MAKNHLQNVLPAEGFMRLAQIVGNPKANPPVAGIIPISKSSWWEGCRTGKYPRPVKLGPKTTVWRIEDIRALIQEGV